MAVWAQFPGILGHMQRGVSCTLSLQACNATVPNMGLTAAPFVVFCRHFALVLISRQV